MGQDGECLQVLRDKSEKREPKFSASDVLAKLFCGELTSILMDTKVEKFIDCLTYSWIDEFN